MKNNIHSLRLINVGGWRKDHYKGCELVGTCSQNFCSLGSNFELKSCWLLALVKKINEKWHFMYTSFRQKSWRILAKLFLIICAFTLGNNKIPVLSHGGTAKKFFISPLFSIFLRQFHSRIEIHLEIMRPRAINEWITRQGHWDE